MRAGGLAPLNLIQPTISLDMPVPSQGHYGFHSFRLLTDFVCLYGYGFWLSLCKIVRSSVILLLPLFKSMNTKNTTLSDRNPGAGFGHVHKFGGVNK